MRILGSKRLSTGSQSSRLRFESTLGPVGIRDRYLLLDGKRAYNLGNNCQTCALLFQRLPGATESLRIEETADRLRHGIDSLDCEVVETLGRGLPEGEYLALLIEGPVNMVKPGAPEDYFAAEQIALWGEDPFYCLPHDPRVPYYRAGDCDLGQGRHLFNFVVPMYPAKWLTFQTVSAYMQELETRGSGTAVALSLLDVKGPADWNGHDTPDPVEHWLCTHYLIDGHHKLHAAAETGKPLRLLSFLALAQGVSSAEQVREAVSRIASGT
jgi:hypothetical protein